MLGFTARKSGNLTAAGDFYEQALAINPRHTGALEYQGELFIQLGKIELAKANLEKIDKICWLPCNAERDLKKRSKNRRLINSYNKFCGHCSAVDIIYWH